MDFSHEWHFLSQQLATSQHQMGLMDFFKLLSSVLSSAANKFQQHQEKHSWDCLEQNLGLLGERQECYLFAMQPLHLTCRLSWSWNEPQNFEVELSLGFKVEPNFLNFTNEPISRLGFSFQQVCSVENCQFYTKSGHCSEKLSVRFGSRATGKPPSLSLNHCEQNLGFWCCGRALSHSISSFSFCTKNTTCCLQAAKKL